MNTPTPPATPVPGAGTNFNLTFHIPFSGNLVIWLMLIPTDNTGAPTNQPFNHNNDSSGYLLITTPSGAPVSKATNGNDPGVAGAYTYSQGHLTMSWASLGGPNLFHPQNSAVFFDGYVITNPALQFIGIARGVWPRTSNMVYGPGTTGTHSFQQGAAFTMTVAAPVG